MTLQELLNYVGGTLAPARQAELDRLLADPQAPLWSALQTMSQTQGSRKGFLVSESHPEANPTPQTRSTETSPSAEVPLTALTAGYHCMVRTAVRNMWEVVVPRGGNSLDELLAGVIQRLFNSNELPPDWVPVFWPVVAREIRLFIRELAEARASLTNQWSTLNESTLTRTSNPDLAITRDTVWQQLHRTHPQRALIAELTLFLGLPSELIAAVTGLSRKAAVSEWNATKHKFATFGC
jgi:hypothetical protein